MTITIHRQSRMQRIAVSLLVSAVAVVAAIQISGTVTEDSGSPAHVADPAPASNPWIRLQQVQDNFLTPRAIVAEEAQKRAFLEVQDAYLPPAVATPSTAGQRAFLEVQDDFLPPETPQPAEGNAIRLGLSVPQ
jgi:hypothetical protein